ncbi:MAG: YncE family protein [Thermoplasmatales archaeon]
MARLLLKVAVVAIVFVFLGTSFASTDSQNDHVSYFREKLQNNVTPLVQNNNSSAGYVKYTIDLVNNSLIPGNFFDTHNGLAPFAPTFNSSNTDTIAVGSLPVDVAFDSSNGYVYVANSGSNNVSVIKGSTNSVIDTIAVSSDPDGMAFDPSNGYLYVANSYSKNVSVIDGATNSVIDTIAVSSDPEGVAFDSSNGYVYATNSGSGLLSIISTSSSQSSLKSYPVTFTESGLPSGTTWYVNETSISKHAISPNNITFSLANGTYSFIATNLSNYYTTTHHLTVTVNGNSIKETVDYYQLAYITGTISPINATLTINGNAVSISSTGTFYVSVTSGTYDIVASDSGYHSYYNNFTLNQGNTKNLAISLKAVSKTSGISSTEIYAIIGAIMAIVIIAGVVMAIRRR